MRTYLIVGLTLFTLPVFGQSGSGVITGSVKDATESPIPGANVAVQNQETGVRLTTTANEAGLYRFGALVPGSYRIEAWADGFDKIAREGATLQVSQTISIDLALQVGQQQET